MNGQSPPVPLRRGRLAALLAALAVAAAAAAIVLPAGLIRLAVLCALALPAGALLIDRPRLILYLLIFILFSNIDIFFPFRLFRIVTLALIAVVVLGIAGGRRLFVHDRVFLALAAVFLIAVIQSIAFAVDLRAALAQLSVYARVLIVTLLVPQLVRKRRDVVTLLAVIVAAVLLSALLPLAVPPPEQYASRSLIWGEGVLRYEGYAGEANFFAFQLVFTAPLVLFLTARFSRPRIVRPLLLAALGAMFYVLAMSFSRGGFVSMAAAMGMLLIVERRNRAVMIPGLVVLGIGLIAAPAIYWERISTLIEAARYVSADYAVLIRYETMRVALLLGAHHPLFGVGPDNFILQAGRFIPYVKDVHNVFLQAFAELGVPGVAALAALAVWNFRVAGSMMRRRGDPEAALLGRMLLVHQAAVIVNAMFIPALYDHVFWIALVLPTVASSVYLGGTGAGGSAGPPPGGEAGIAAAPASR